MPNTPWTTYCNHSYQLIREIRTFIDDAIAPVITELEGDRSRPTPKRDAAIACVYLRIAAWLTTFEKLNQTRDMQAIGTGARCVFEHYLDLKWFERFPEEKWLDCFWAFPEIDRYRAAKKVVEHKARSPESRIDTAPHQGFMARMDAKESFDAKVSRLWGTDNKGEPREPRDHWTGVGSLRKRAEQSGPDCEDRYVQIYPILSALVHAGPTPCVGDLTWLEKQMGFAYFHAFLNARDAIELACELLAIRQKISGFDAYIQQVLKWQDEAMAALTSA